MRRGGPLGQGQRLQAGSIGSLQGQAAAAGGGRRTGGAAAWTCGPGPGSPGGHHLHGTSAAHQRLNSGGGLGTAQGHVELFPCRIWEDGF